VRIPDLTPSDLSPAEHLLIWRRREGYTQPVAAEVLGISLNSLIGVERKNDNSLFVCVPRIEKLHPHEICFILRRRSGLTIPECAEQAGVSRYWYNLMEQGKVCSDRLFQYWGEK
jgi:transcriptional regulator with XRE-family HTH domain